MSTVLAELTRLLNQQKVLYEELLELAKEKQKILVKGSLEALDSLTKKEEALIFQAGKLEEQRYQCGRQVISLLGLKEDVPLSEIKEKAPLEYKKPLETVLQELTGLFQDLTRLNEENTNLIQQSLRFVNFTMEVISQQSKPTYTPDKDVKMEQISRLLDKKV
jgi:flagellar biosynthesis/type III secretory pathway chaperone